MNKFRESLNSLSETDSFDSPQKYNESTKFVTQIIKPPRISPDFIMTTEEEKTTSKSVTGLLPKWSAGENIRNYTQRLKHAWEYVKNSFDEKKFCNLVRITVSSNLGEIIDNYTLQTSEVTVDGLCKELILKLDRQPAEYIADFKSAQKGSTESYSAFAHRLLQLYKKGTQQTGELGEGEKRLLVEQFLDSLPFSEASTLKLIATEEELKNIDALALRASRTRKPKRPISSLMAIGDEASKEGNQQGKTEKKQSTFSKGPRFNNRKNFNCHYCSKFGHGWRTCFQRARQDPNWRPVPAATQETEQKK